MAICGVRRTEDDEIVAVGMAGEVAVYQRRLDHALGLDAVEPTAQPWATLCLDEFLV
jgi:hypothetical protein